MNRTIRPLVALTTLSLITSAGAGAQRAGGPGDANESAQLPMLTAPVRISADFTIKAIQTDSFNASYPRVIQLQHYVPGKGQLLLTFAGGGPASQHRSSSMVTKMTPSTTPWKLATIARSRFTGLSSNVNP